MSKVPTKLRLPNFVPIVRTRVVDLTRRISGRAPQNLSLLSGSAATAGDVPTETSRTEDSVVPAVAAAPMAPAAAPEPDISEVSFKGGHHEEIKKSDFGFNMNLSALERFAREQAQAHAQAGLPRMNAPTSEELPIEAVLRARASELFVDWKTRSTRRVQDALQAAVLEAGNGVVALRHAIDQARLAQYKAGKLDAELQVAKTRSEGKDRTLAYGARLGRKAYWALISVLTVIEWVANVAIFRGLLPPDKGTEQALLQLFSDTEDNVWFGGIQRMFGKAFVFPEAALLALGTIIILMYLTHVCGESRRQLVAFRKDDDPGIAHGLRSRERQARNAFYKSLAGVVTILVFLSCSRGLLASTAHTRLEKQHQKLVALQGQRAAAQAAGDTKQLSQINRDIQEAKAAEEVLQDNSDFGEAISSMNYIIIALNLGLVTVATVAAYQSSEGRLAETCMSDPAVSGLEHQVETALAEIMELRHKARTLDLDIQANIARARYLSTATPTKEWEAKVERLNSVVALFRTENAALRGIDVQNILAFAEYRPIDLSHPELAQQLVLPPEFGECESEYARLRSHLEFLRSDLLPTGTEVAA